MNKIALYITCGLTAVAIAALGQGQQYKLGRPATPQEIRELDISVAPDGSGLPKGRGTVVQGQRIYETLCANCHGDRGQGMLQYPALAGGQGTLKSSTPLRTVEVSALCDHGLGLHPSPKSRMLAPEPSPLTKPTTLPRSFFTSTEFLARMLS